MSFDASAAVPKYDMSINSPLRELMAQTTRSPIELQRLGADIKSAVRGMEFSDPLALCCATMIPDDVLEHPVPGMGLMEIVAKGGMLARKSIVFENNVPDGKGRPVAVCVEFTRDESGGVPHVLVVGQDRAMEIFGNATDG